MKTQWMRSQSGDLYNLSQIQSIKASKDTTTDTNWLIMGEFTDSMAVLGTYPDKQSVNTVMNYVRYWMEDPDDTSVFKFPKADFQVSKTDFVTPT